MIRLISFIFIFISMLNPSSSQEVIELPISLANDSISWLHPEKEYFSQIWQTEVVTNVSKPSLSVFRPKEGTSNGTAVIICPGGGMYALSINSEGRQVAQWLADRGVTAFVLKYRLVPTGDDGTMDLNTDGANVLRRAGTLLPLAVDDALNAITFVRDNADDYGIASDRIGLMGFSAGGAVTMGVTYACEVANRPDFISPIYAWMNIVPKTSIPKNAPPIFVACASDDPLRLAPASVQLYQEWLGNGKTAELHMYAKGGHGFGMRVQNLPSDQWIEHFGAWLDGQGLL